MRRGGGRAAVTSGLACGLVYGLVGCGLGPADDEPQTATVAVAMSDDGTTASNVVDAVREGLNETLADDIPGWDVEVSHVDEDAADGVAGDDVVAVVGGTSPQSVLTLAPELDAASVLFLSLAGYQRDLTRGADPDEPVRPYRTYFGMAVDDEDPLALLADYAIVGRGVESFAVLDAGDENESDEFMAYAREHGVSFPVTGDSTSIADVRDEEVDGVFLSGDADLVAESVTEAHEAGLDVPIFLSPSLRSSAQVSDVSRGNEVSVEPAELDATNGREALAFDAGQAVGIVLSRCLPSATSARDSRRGCTGEMSEVVFDGATGPVAFTSFGEREGGVAEIWTPAQPG